MTVSTRLRLAAALIALAAPALASCGFDVQTDQVYTPGAGVNDRSGVVNVLHALVVSGEDGSGTVVAALVNTSATQDDELTGVTGADPDEQVEVAIDGTVDIPAGKLVQLADDGNVTATGDAIQAGKFVKLTFTFAEAEAVTVDVPVVANTDEFSQVPLPSAS